MKRIAEGAHITVANIYRYFDNKDALFEEIISPVIKRWDFLFNRLETNVIPQAYLLGANVKKYDDATLADEIEFIDSHRDELYLVFFCASGSQREKYVEELTARIADANYRLLQAVREKNPRVVDFPPVFMHIFASLKIDLYKEIIRNNISKDSLRRLFESLTIVTQRGWYGLQDSINSNAKN